MHSWCNTYVYKWSHESKALHPAVAWLKFSAILSVCVSVANHWNDSKLIKIAQYYNSKCNSHFRILSLCVCIQWLKNNYQQRPVSDLILQFIIRRLHSSINKIDRGHPQIRLKKFSLNRLKRCKVWQKHVKTEHRIIYVAHTLLMFPLQLHLIKP